MHPKAVGTCTRVERAAVKVESAGPAIVGYSRRKQIAAIQIEGAAGACVLSEMNYPEHVLAAGQSPIAHGAFSHPGLRRRVGNDAASLIAVSYTHLRAHETGR